MGILHVTNIKIKKYTNTRWLIDAKAHQVLALNVILTFNFKSLNKHKIIYMKTNKIFKSFILLCIFSISVNKIYCQSSDNQIDNQIEKIKYTIIDSDSKSFHPLFGSKSGQIKFDLVELCNLTQKKTILGVEINIKTNEIEKNSSSIAFANVGSFWGISSSITYKNIQNEGYIFLDKNDLEVIINFLNEFIGATGQAQDKFTLYKISIRNQFELGMVYDNEILTTNKWGFVFSSNNSVYKLDYQDGINMIRSLSRFYDYINANQTY